MKIYKVTSPSIRARKAKLQTTDAQSADRMLKAEQARGDAQAKVVAVDTAR